MKRITFLFSLIAALGLTFAISSCTKDKIAEEARGAGDIEMKSREELRAKVRALADEIFTGGETRAVTNNIKYGLEISEKGALSALLSPEFYTGSTSVSIYSRALMAGMVGEYVAARDLYHSYYPPKAYYPVPLTLDLPPYSRTNPAYTMGAAFNDVMEKTYSAYAPEGYYTPSDIIGEMSTRMSTQLGTRFPPLILNMNLAEWTTFRRAMFVGATSVIDLGLNASDRNEYYDNLFAAYPAYDFPIDLIKEAFTQALRENATDEQRQSYFMTLLADVEGGVYSGWFTTDQERLLKCALSISAHSFQIWQSGTSATATFQEDLQSLNTRYLIPANLANDTSATSQRAWDAIRGQAVGFAHGYKLAAIQGGIIQGFYAAANIWQAQKSSGQVTLNSWTVRTNYWSYGPSLANVGKIQYNLISLMGQKSTVYTWAQLSAWLNEMIVTYPNIAYIPQVPPGYPVTNTTTIRTAVVNKTNAQMYTSLKTSFPANEPEFESLRYFFDGYSQLKRSVRSSYMTEYKAVLNKHYRNSDAIQGALNTVVDAETGWFGAY